MLFNIEIQSTKDPDMPERLLHYSLEAKREHGLPVYSCVIYLRDVGEVQQPPYTWKGVDGKTILWFDYLSIELAKIPTEELRQTGLVGLLPLLILTKGGARHEVLEEVVTELSTTDKFGLLAVSKLLAPLVFSSDEELE